MYAHATIITDDTIFRSLRMKVVPYIISIESISYSLGRNRNGPN